MVTRDKPPFDIRKGDKWPGRDSDGGLIFGSEGEEWLENDSSRIIEDGGAWYCDCPPGEPGFEHRREPDEDSCPVCGAQKEDSWLPDPKDEAWLCDCGQSNTVLDDRCTCCGASSPWGAEDGCEDEEWVDETED
jgi:hypothetical protein